jgi:UDP-N-acetylmuramyl pentapeptide phosphotransferase/UDP-N-acetylglucosamine-1-phosphate transferase
MCTLGGLIVLFFIGIKDDILIIDPKKKLLGQLLASIIAVWLGGMRITHFHNVFGIGDIAPVAGIIFTIFLFLILINGFNLIDGIDGLASGLGIVISSVYGIWFIISSNVTFGVISLALAGALIAFFRFNVFSKNKKIFLGDTGSMLIGFIISVLTVQFIEYNLNTEARFHVDSAPAVAYGLLIVPLIDMLRVVVLRFWNGKSPFKADRNHIHHTLLHFGYSHLGITLAMVAVTLIFFTASFLLRGIGVLKLMALLTALAILVLSTPWVILKLSHKQGK